MESNPTHRLTESATAFMSEGYLIDNSERVQRLSITIYRLLVQGAPVSVLDLSEALSWPRNEVEGLLAAFPASAVSCDDISRVIAFVGLSLEPTAHQFEVADVTLYTWCALDALFLPEILGLSARLITHCPVAGEVIRIEMAPDRVIAATPADAVMSIVAPDAEKCRDDLRAAFCNHVSFLRVGKRSCPGPPTARMPHQYRSPMRTQLGVSAMQRGIRRLRFKKGPRLAGLVCVRL